MNKWYWVQEFGGNAVSTIAIGIFTLLFSGIAIVGFTTFGSWYGIWMVPILVFWGILTATRFVDDVIRYDENTEQRSGWYWLLELTGDVVMILGLGWVAMIVGGVSTYGRMTFVEDNPWILWSEIPMTFAMGVAVSLNWVNDIIRFRKVN